MRRRKNVWLLLAVIAVAMPSIAGAQVRAIYDNGANALARQLQRIQTTSSVMHTGAHPDDEDSALVAYHARRENARTAYLSLTRGSGGQNIIGTEQSDLLGVIRSEELLQARRLDGADQFFTRANDFGFSKHLSEPARLWDEEAVLGDMVRAIRQFRPIVIVSRWNGTPADGHGHHQFAGYLTPLAIEAAMDPDRYPEHIDEGLSPWQVRKFYVMQRFNPDSVTEPSLVVNTGEVDPVVGRSYYEIGMQGRSQQKTQQMGSLELRGDQFSGMQLIDSRVDASDAEESVFDGIDTSIAGIALFEPDASAKFTEFLAELERTTASLLTSYDPLNPQTLVPTLVTGLRFARAARREAQGVDTVRLLEEKIDEFEAALALAAGVSIDALADTETVVPGSTFQVAVRKYVPEGFDIQMVGNAITVTPGLDISDTNEEVLANERAYRRRDIPDVQFMFNVEVPADAKITQPYWLDMPRNDFMYDWSQADFVQTQPFGKPLVSVLAAFEIDGHKFAVEKEVQYRFVDRVRGEIRRRIDVVPLVSVEPATELVIVPMSSNERQYEMLLTLRNNANRNIDGTAGFKVPDGWILEPESADFSLAAKPASATLSFNVTLPDDVAAGEYQLEGIATVNGVTYRQAMREIAHPHIQTHRVYEPSVTEFEVIDVSVAQVRIGYVMGSGDEVPDALRRLGLQVTLLDDDTLTTGSLSSFDTIVVGIRTSQTRPAFVANNRRLLDFVEQGGTLVVQYQQPDFAAQNLAPFPVSMDGNVRVVDETAPVVILEPDHPVFNFPNRITADDFEGWLQERNNYNFTSFDRNRYLPLTESHDPGEPESDGAMLYSEIGEGRYVYTSYSWFRQLPNGIPGAYRLFANLLSLPAAPKKE